MRRLYSTAYFSAALCFNENSSRGGGVRGGVIGAGISFSLVGRVLRWGGEVQVLAKVEERGGEVARMWCCFGRGSFSGCGRIILSQGQ